MTLKDELAKTLREVFAGVEELPLQFNPVAAENPYEKQVDSLQGLSESMRFCKDCSAHLGREKLVFGIGHAKPKVLFLGDIPSRKDDEAGKPFSDEAGELLTKMIAAMGLRLEEVYLTNLLKCKPPTGQIAREEEALICLKYLEKQIELLQPKLIVAFGELPARTLARADIGLEKLRLQDHSFKGRKLFLTHHPRELLQAPDKKREAWNDLQKVMSHLK